jgi:glycosyltransferase involved in cell wall biosynthesis
MTQPNAPLPRRLLFLLNDAPFFVSHRLSLAEAAVARGVDVHVAAPADSEAAARITAAGATFHEVPLRRGGMNVLGELRLTRVFYDLIRTLKPDLIHAVTMKPVIYGGAAARLANAPAVVFSVTGLGHLFLTGTVKARLLRRMVMALFRLALHHPCAFTIFQNTDDRDLFVDAGAVEAQRTTVIPGTGVDLDLFHPRTSDAPALPVVMFPARLIGEKGVREFVAAARQLKEEGSDARFVLVGRSDPENPSDVGPNQITAWEQEGLVEHWGFRDHMPTTLREADVVCLPSYREGSPRSLIEALATGLPLVTTDTTGCRDMVEPDGNGYLVPVGDGTATAQAIVLLLADPERRHRMGQRSREMAERTFAVGPFVATTFALYSQVIARAKGKS